METFLEFQTREILKQRAHVDRAHAQRVQRDTLARYDLDFKRITWEEYQSLLERFREYYLAEEKASIVAYKTAIQQWKEGE